MKTLVFLLTALLAINAHAENITGRVISITDGDTLTLLDTANRQHKIRLAGIDSPEKAQDFGQKATANLSALTLNQDASAECWKRYRNLFEICVVTVAGKDVGLEQVRMGMAWWFRQSISEQTAQQRADYEQAELKAKLQRMGLWNSKNPIPPWDWRHGRLDE